MSAATSRRRGLKAARTRALNKKHAGTGKHASTAKHTSTAKKTATAHAQTAHRTAAQVKAAHVRALGDVPCCVAEAIAASLRLTGRPVSDRDVLALHMHAAGSLSVAATIPATLEAAYRHGLAGVRPLDFGLVDVTGVTFGSGTVLGLELPEGPHAVAGGDDGVWSWGGLYLMTAEAVVEEAWQVTWA